MTFFLRMWLLITITFTCGAEVVFEGPIRSDIFQADRKVRVALPASYKSASEKRYPVLYIHDGQNAFTTAGPHAAFGWGNWELDKTAERLAAEGKIREVILVAIDCSNRRYQEYRGPASLKGENLEYEKYRDFLVEELKPYIDQKYRTKPGPEHTGVLGSSMGGICSLALAWERPEVFGLAASISGAYQVEEEAFLKELRNYQGAKKPFGIYLDSGTTDFTGGDDGAIRTKAVFTELKRIGWTEPRETILFVDKVLSMAELEKLNLTKQKTEEATRSQHNELYWRLRAWRPLQFMFPPE